MSETKTEISPEAGAVLVEISKDRERLNDIMEKIAELRKEVYDSAIREQRRKKARIELRQAVIAMHLINTRIECLHMKLMDIYSESARRDMPRPYSIKLS